MEQNEEIWKDIEGYEGRYQVSNYGDVKSCERHEILCDGRERTRKMRMLKPYTDKHGYKYVTLFKKGDAIKKKIHRLVGQAFIPNPEKLPCINHKDENPSNNHISNLEWCSVKYNNTYGSRIQRMVEKKINGKKSKPVIQVTLKGEVVNIYPSANEVKRQLGWDVGGVCHACNNDFPTYKGYVWRFIVND